MIITPSLPILKGGSKGYTAPMVDLDTYKFKYLITGKLYLKNSFLVLMSKNYMSHNMYVTSLNYFM